MTTTPKIHCAEGITAVIPEHLRELRLTRGVLLEKHACGEGLGAFINRFPEGATYTETRQWIAEINRQDWENWLNAVFGGDVATAGDSGTATAGEAGVISIQYYDSQTDRFKVMIGYIGEGGLKAGVKYKLNDQAQFEEVPA